MQYNLTLTKTMADGSREPAVEPFDRKEAGASLFADAAAELIVQQLDAVAGSGSTMLENLIGEQKARVLSLLEAALRKRSDLHLAIEARYTEVPVETSVSEAVRDEKGRMSGTITRRYTVAT